MFHVSLHALLWWNLALLAQSISSANHCIRVSLLCLPGATIKSGTGQMGSVSKGVGLSWGWTDLTRIYLFNPIGITLSPLTTHDFRWSDLNVINKVLANCGWILPGLHRIWIKATWNHPRRSLFEPSRHMPRYSKQRSRAGTTKVVRVAGGPNTYNALEGLQPAWHVTSQDEIEHVGSERGWVLTVSCTISGVAPANQRRPSSRPFRESPEFQLGTPQELS